MNDADWVPVLTTPNQAQAEILRGLLEAQGVSVWLLQEPAARAIGIQMGPLGEIQILVPKDQQAQAEEVIDAFFRGDFEQT
ncbi:MAG: DUF2007 domain-containing protein [Chloroflexi bacterium]|nr:DUF2007 domain-containing protein [Chloroflexota bacterium]